MASTYNAAHGSAIQMDRPSKISNGMRDDGMRDGGMPNKGASE